MTFLPTGINPFVERVRKAAALDEASAREAVRLGVYDALVEGVDESVRKAVEDEALERSVEARRGLVRAFIAKRIEGEPVDNLLLGALAVGAVSSSISKVEEEPRDSHGRWTKVITALTETGSSSRNTGTQAGSLLDRNKYDHLHGLGTALQMNPHTSAVGIAAQAAAGFGPEAERVLGPHIRRAAYRYRGTDLRPDPILVDALAKLPEGRTANGKVVGPPNQALLDSRGDFGVLSMDKHVPSAEDYMVSVASGELPPSRGVIIDARGRLATTAVGYRGDHFLPFNLRNLTGLQGGQYVRTRAAGGPTKEDLYTAVVAGARQIQVVSNSGVFTVDFDPDMRGNRRYNDQAARMVSRYDAILSSIGQGHVTQGELPKERREAIRAQVLRDNERAPAADLNRIYRKAIEEEQDRASFGVDPDTITVAVPVKSRDAFGRTFTEQKELPIAEAKEEHYLTLVEAHEKAGGGEVLSRQSKAELRQQADRFVDNQARNNAYRKLHLDGEGYERALKALAVEFPQFITSTNRTERDAYISDKFGRKAAGPSRGTGQFQREQDGRNLAAATSKVTIKPKGNQKPADAPAEPKPEESTVVGATRGPGSDTAPHFENLAASVPKTVLAPARAQFNSMVTTLMGMSADPEPDMTLEQVRTLGGRTRASANTIHWMADKYDGGKELFDKAVSGSLPAKESDALQEALANLPTSGFDAESLRSLHDDAKQPMAVLAINKPFEGKPSDRDTDLDRILNGGKPPLYPDIAAAGASTKNLAALPLTRAELDQAENFKTDAKGQESEAKALFEGLSEAEQSQHDYKRVNADQDAKNFLRGVSYAAAYRAAAAYERLKGVEPTPFPEAPTGAAPEVEQRQPQGQLEKRASVVFLDPVSPVAKRMQRALRR